MTRLKNPFTPVWWFLISKGYKTYLLLANNFINYYPRYELPTPPLYKDLIGQSALKLYPENYDQHSGDFSRTEILPFWHRASRVFIYYHSQIDRVIFVLCDDIEALFRSVIIAGNEYCTAFFRISLI